MIDGARNGQRRPVPRPIARHAGALAASFVVGSIPFSQVAAKVTRGVDLRDVGGGTVSGTALHEVAGFGPLAVAGVLEVAKGALGPLVAGRDRPGLQAAAAGAAVVGHNWSPFLAGAGGRGISPATGALLATAPAGAAVLLGGMAVGRLAGETAIGSIVADAALAPVLRLVHGRAGTRVGLAVLAPMLLKRVVGNRPPEPETRWRAYRNRLLYDRDEVNP